MAPSSRSLVPGARGWAAVLGACGLLAGVGTAAALLATAPTAAAARLVSAEVAVDGKVVLRGSTSDDGKPDADEVWNGLAGIRFQPTEDFAALGVRPDATSLVLGDDPPKPGLGRVLLDVSYGGRAELRQLRLSASQDPRLGTVWRVHPDTAKEHFKWRLISRNEAALLRDASLPR